jgi:hypothetical protein
MTRGCAVLDTNLFYYATGIFSDPRLRENWLEILMESHDLFISSPSIVEVLTNANLQQDERWICLNSMFSNRYSGVVQIGYLPFDTTELKEVTLSRDATGLDRIRQEALGLKIQCEADFLKFVFMVLLGAFLHVLFVDRSVELIGQQQANLTEHFKALMVSNSVSLRASLFTALANGYSNRDVKDIVEGHFNDLLFSYAHASLINLHTVRQGLSLDQLQSATGDQQKLIQDAVQADPILSQLLKDHANPISLLRKRNYRDSVQSYLGQIEAYFSACSLMPVEALRFFVNRLQTGLVSGAKFRKNDVIDLLLIFSTFHHDTVILTNDSNMLAGLETASAESHRISMTLRNP